LTQTPGNPNCKLVVVWARSVDPVPDVRLGLIGGLLNVDDCLVGGKRFGFYTDPLLGIKEKCLPRLFSVS